MSGLHARGGFVVDIEWNDGIVVEAVITSSAGGATTVTYPTSTGRQTRKVTLSPGGKTIIN